MRIPLVGGALLCALIVGFAVGDRPACGDDAAGDPQAFDKALERIHEACKKEQFDSALRRLESLLKKHKGKGYVRARRVELEDLAERISFGVEFDAPEVGDVISGRVEKWDRKKGYLSVKYTPATDGDIERVKGGWLALPAAITGSFLLEVSGDSYPSRPNSAPRMLLAGSDARSKRPVSWLIVFGTPRRETGSSIEWLPARILHYAGGSEKELAKVDKVPIGAGKRFRAQLKVTKSNITVGINGKTIFNRRRSKTEHCQVAFDVKGWKTCKFAGTIEPAWIQGRLDKVTQAKLKDFRKRYKRTRHLPAWLFEDGPTDPGPVTPEAEAPTARTGANEPVPVDRKHRSAVRRAARSIKKRDWAGARRTITELERAGAPRAVTALLSARVSVGTGELTRGLEEVDICLEKAPNHLDALLLKAQALRHLGRIDEAFRTFRYAIKKHRKEPGAYETAAISMLRAARPDAAQTVTELAVQAGVTSRDLERVAHLVVKAERGPMWNRTFEYRSRNYHVLSDISKESCIEAAKILEDALVSYRVNLEWVSRNKERLYPVYLFSGRKGFQEYMSEFEALMGTVPDQVAGLYSPLLKQLVIWHLPAREEMLQVIRHEGFHQYLDRWMPDAPIWFNEGLAVYHQNAVKKRGKLHFGDPHPYYLDVLKAKGLVPLDEFLLWSRGEFYADAPRSYGQAWALMHLLKHGKSEHKKLLSQLTEDLKTKPALQVIFDRFPASRLKSLNTALEAHIEEMRSP